MKYRRLGGSGLKVSEISLGSWLTYGGTVADDTAVKLIHAAFKAGVNLFDTADVYHRGAAESVLGKALKDLPRHEVVVATKVMGRVWEGPLGAGLSRKHIFDAMDQSLLRLGLDYVDLYQAHAPDKDTPLEETLGAFNDLVRAGKTRYLGLSNFSTEETLEALRIAERNGWDKVISLQPLYNLLDRKVEPKLAPLSAKEGLGWIIYSPLAQGVLTGKYRGGKTPAGSRATTKAKMFMDKWMTPDARKQVGALERVAKRKRKAPAQVALAWTLLNPVVSSAIIGATSQDQLKENLKAVNLVLTAKDRAELDAAFPVAGEST